MLNCLTSDSPEKVAVVFLIASHNVSVGQHNLRLFKHIDSEAILAAKPAIATAER